MTANVSELERQARELLRPEVYDYYAGGSGGEVTLRANSEAWCRVRFLPRVLRDVSAVQTGVRLGHPLNLELRTPIAVAPTAFHRLAHPEGEIATASAAARAGALFVLSTRSSRRIEEVAGAVADAEGSWWFQVYMMRERDLTAGLVRRAAAAGAQALVLTGDTPVVGRQALVPGGGVISDRDIEDNLGSLDDLSRAAFVPASPADIGWLEEISGGLPVVVKGVLRADDAAACLSAGAAAVIVSNHGGRQLDQAMPTALAFPAVRAAAAGRPVFVDGGVRSPESVLAGLALGAPLVFVGRPVLWALACGGTAGVQEWLEDLTAGLAHVMALAGAPSVAALAGLGTVADPGTGTSG
ncbi:MAG: alpha-hydroxy acid oxidase [Streptosporangiaceae bacterium]